MYFVGQWQQSPMFLVVGVGLWYGYAKGCALDWCATRLCMQADLLDDMFKVI